MLDRDGLTVSVFDDEAPQPYPAVGVHDSAHRNTALANDETTMHASDTTTVREAATGG
jgi:hypothetical protein